LKAFIIPVFIPHLGCPHRCIFCEQKKISSQPLEPLHKGFVRKVIEQALRSKRLDRGILPEVAFYGGTFTMLPVDLMGELLDEVRPYLKKGLVHSIRISTRPDAVDEERLDLLWSCGVKTVELGVQSMDDAVLSLSGRGHGSGDVIRAVERLKFFGFKVGVQLMPGLPGDSAGRFLSTIEKVIPLRPDLARLYPAVVIEGTALGTWYREGRYKPLELGEAVELCVEGCMRLESAGIPVIRIGLMSSPALLREGEIVGGPWHPAFGFLVRSAIYHKKIERDLPRVGRFTRIILSASPREIGLLRGYRNQGLQRIEKITGAEIVGVRTDETNPLGRIRVIPERMGN
jgi:histone acetyltransferase (RNA polymerase elongator complex component)